MLLFCSGRGVALVEQHSAALDARVEEAKDQKSVKGLIQKQLQNLSIPQDFLNLHDEIKDLSFRCFQQDLPFQRAIKDGKSQMCLGWFEDTLIRLFGFCIVVETHSPP